MGGLLTKLKRTLAVLPGTVRGSGPGLEPVVVHVHLPKSGGSSLNRLLDQSFGSAHLKLYTEDPKFRHTPASMLEALQRHPNAKAISSHQFRTFPETIGNRLPLYVCFIREPVSRHLSYFRYCKKEYEQLTKAHRAALPSGFKEMSMADYFRWQTRQDRQSAVTPNRQVYRLAGETSFDRAVKVLEGFLFVGITDQLQRGVSLLREKLKPHDLRLTEQPVARDNDTRKLYDRTEADAADPAVQAYLQGLDLDSKLYAWARERFEREATQIGK